jgi:hypothetical protein
MQTTPHSRPRRLAAVGAAAAQTLEDFAQAIAKAFKHPKFLPGLVSGIWGP